MKEVHLQDLVPGELYLFKSARDGADAIVPGRYMTPSTSFSRFGLDCLRVHMVLEGFIETVETDDGKGIVFELTQDWVTEQLNKRADLIVRYKAESDVLVELFDELKS